MISCSTTVLMLAVNSPDSSNPGIGEIEPIVGLLVDDLANRQRQLDHKHSLAPHRRAGSSADSSQDSCKNPNEIRVEAVQNPERRRPGCSGDVCPIPRATLRCEGRLALLSWPMARET